LTEWRKLYDTLNIQWKNTGYFNPDVLYNPSAIDYWLDFIDTSEYSDYSVNQIGRRTHVENKGKQITSLYIRDPLEEIFFLKHKDINKIEQYN
jgi:hypothetical protein